MTQIIEIKDNPFWEHDIDKAIAEFECTYGITPHMYIGKTFIELVTIDYEFIKREPSDNSTGIIAIYKGIPCEYDPGIHCVILKA